MDRNIRLLDRPAGGFGHCGGAAANRGLLQLYDRNYTRTEMIIRKPVQTPRCSPNLDDFKPTVRIQEKE